MTLRFNHDSRILHPSRYQEIILSAAEHYDVPESLIRSIIQVESNWNPYAYNPEPRYRWFWDVKRNRPFRRVSSAEAASKVPPKDFPALQGDRDQEWWGQQASIGLMQAMGAVARERGFDGPYLLELVDPVIGIEIGTAHLAHLIQRHSGAHGIAGAIRAYNTGSAAPSAAGDAYHAKVLAVGRGV